MGEETERRARALARLAELDDEPGGDEFLARMGVLGDWVVDFAFGDVHTRPGLDARERELIIVAVLTTLGSSDPQVRAHIRALRAIDVPWDEIAFRTTRRTLEFFFADRRSGTYSLHLDDIS